MGNCCAAPPPSKRQTITEYKPVAGAEAKNVDKYLAASGKHDNEVESLLLETLVIRDGHNYSAKVGEEGLWVGDTLLEVTTASEWSSTEESYHPDTVSYTCDDVLDNTELFRSFDCPNPLTVASSEPPSPLAVTVSHSRNLNESTAASSHNGEDCPHPNDYEASTNDGF